MPRAKYIYLVRLKDTRELVGAFTVKREAREWADRSIWPLDELELSAMQDGCRIEIMGKHEGCREW